MSYYNSFKELLSYNPDTGDLTWLSRENIYIDPHLVGKKAGYIKGDYRFIEVLGKEYREHNVAWLLHYGDWPKSYLDHINGQPLDNRISNLREATPRQNAQNRKSHKNTSSKYKGVSWQPSKNKWVAQITNNGKAIKLGFHDYEEDAALAYDLAAKHYFGEYARLNNPY